MIIFNYSADDFDLEDSPTKKPEGYILDSEDSGDEYVPGFVIYCLLIYHHIKCIIKQ